jgi:hypothetical protein
MTRHVGLIALLILITTAAVAQQLLDSPPWQMKLGALGPDSLTFGGQVLAGPVRLSGFPPDYSRGRFDMRGATVETGQDKATWTRKDPGNQEATIQVELKPLECLISLDTTVTQAGPSEFSVDLQAGALATNSEYARVIVDGRARELDLTGKFPTLNIAKEIRFLRAERTLIIQCAGYVLQDRRDKNQGLFLVASVPSDGREPIRHRKTVRMIVEPTPPERLAGQTAILAQREATRRDLPVLNGGFEDATLKPWSDNPRAAVDKSIKHSGEQSARITIPATQTDRTGIYLVQNIPAQEGQLYQASAWVRAENVKGASLGDMSPTGVDIIIEFADKTGKWLAPGDYADGLYGTKDWQRISTDASRAPAGTGYAIIFLSLRGTGTGWFDDVTLSEITQHVVLQEPLDQTTVADNTPTFVWAINAPGAAMLELSTKGDFPAADTQRLGDIREKRVTLTRPLAPGQWYWRVTLPGATSAVWSFRQTAPITADCAEPVISPDHAFMPRPDQKALVRCSDNVGVKRIKVALGGQDITGQARLTAKGIEITPPGGWKVGLHRLKIEAWDAAGNRGERTVYLTHARSLPTKKWLPQGGVSIGGKPRFVLGMYGVLTEHLPEMQAAGYDFVHNYTWDGAGTNESALEYLDACRKHNLQAFIGFSRAALQANDLDFVAERVGALMRHPALLAWYLFDEPDLPHQYVSPDQLRGQYDLIHALDPTHPVIVTVAQRNLMPDYHDSYDVYWSMDYQTPAANVTNYEWHRAQLKPGVPIMSIVHCYDGKQKAGGDSRPDPAKFQPDGRLMRANAFMMIAHQSSGLGWWWWGQGTNIFLTVAHVPEAWAALQQTVADIRTLEPVLTSPAPVRMWVERGSPEPPERDAALESRTPTEVHCWEKTLPDRTVLITVNRDPQPGRAKITSPKLRAGEVKVWFEARTIKAEQGCLTDDYKPLEVHVYEVR